MDNNEEIKLKNGFKIKKDILKKDSIEYEFNCVVCDKKFKTKRKIKQVVQKNVEEYSEKNI